MSRFECCQEGFCHHFVSSTRLQHLKERLSYCTKMTLNIKLKSHSICHLIVYIYDTSLKYLQKHIMLNEFEDVLIPKYLIIDRIERYKHEWRFFIHLAFLLEFIQEKGLTITKLGRKYHPIMRKEMILKSLHRIINRNIIIVRL